jgi:c-di-GMP-binding flagellar brake protein YcgR
MGVNFVLQKPISSLNASRCFHAALSFMERERRRYFRHPVKMLVTVILDEKELRATSTNVSERGIALMLHQAIPKNATPRLQFTLPETKMALEIEAEVAWADLKGHAGLRFLKVPPSTQELLEKWLGERMEKHPLAGVEKLPGATPEAIQ